MVSVILVVGLVWVSTAKHNFMLLFNPRIDEMAEIFPLRD